MRKKVLDFLGFIICVAVVLGIVSVIALVGGSTVKESRGQPTNGVL